MKRGFFNFGKDKYAAPQVAPVPAENDSNNNGTLLNEVNRQIQVMIYDDGKPDSLYKALGALEVAKDIVKHTISAWHEKEKRMKGIITPIKGNGHG